ncbi:MAG TPA: PD-(D/E)XK nuclease-like domain-containing protein [Anaerolineaceae bacterium]|nr:PD-(D/E)XK nuclease-like domain-containing protein [Clostridia bacterium]HPK26833.1 PD-(D/E)XK nuclease-like domain-containing protein [Anaerolineaceae bacterium]
MITESNYHSPESSLAYMGASQFLEFTRCEAAALAQVKGEWQKEITTAMLVGSYVDAHFSGALDVFTAQHPEIMLKGGGLKSEFRHALKIIERMERDAFYMKYMAGEKQVIRIGEIAGVPFKIKIDVLHPGKAIVDQKVMRDFEPVWKDGAKRPFAEVWGYDIQGAVYREVEGNGLPFYLAAATKQDEPDLAVISIPDDVLDERIMFVRELAPRYQAIKHGEVEPTRCEHCDYCRATKTLTEPVDYRDIA